MKGKLCLLLILCLLTTAVFAQTRTIAGRVVSDSSGAAIPGVNVTLKGSNRGTITNAAGNYSIMVPQSGKAVLVFSSIGFNTVEVDASNRTAVNATLTSSSASLDVVIIGYQAVRRKDVLASVSSIGAKDLKDVPINNVAEALNGRLAGVTATTSEGSPDAQVRVRIRGGMSITQTNDPLYVIDGVQVDNGLTSISPQDIQSIDVLKDASATAIYGARGANGVIVITTKSGRPGRTVVNVNSFVGVRKIAKVLDVLQPYDFVVYQAERARLQGGADSAGFLKAYGTTWDTLNVYKDYDFVDWQREVFGQTGLTSTHNVSASGGSKKITFNAGYTFNREKAIVLNSTYNRHLFNLKGEYRITNNLRVGVTSRYSSLNVYGAGVSADNNSASLSRIRNTLRYRPYLSSAQDIEDYIDPSVSTGIGNGLNLINPIQLANAEFRRKTTNNLNVTAFAQYTILKGLTFRSTLGYDFARRMDRQYFDTLSPQSKSNNTKPFVALDTTTTTSINNSNVLTYTVRPWADHNFDFLLGEETLELRGKTQSMQVRNYPYNIGYNRAFTNIDSGAILPGFPRLTEVRSTQLSFFGRIGYSYKDKYLLSANLRYDGSSKFAAAQRWGYFPAGSVAWRIKRENFLQNVSFISDAKLRFGIGTMGNNRVGDYLYLNTFANNGTRYYGLNNQVVIGYVPASLPNEILKWEATVNRNWGLDLSLLKNRLNMSVDYYVNSSKDLLLQVNIDPTYGFSSQLQNVGETENRGWEFQLNADILNSQNGLNWSASFNISHNNNRVKALASGQVEALQTAYGLSGAADYTLRVGETIGTMYGLVNDGFYTVNDFTYDPATKLYTLKSGVADNAAIIGLIQPGSIKFRDISGPNGRPDGKIDFNYDRTIIGNPNPKLSGGLNQQFRYKGWDASVFVNFLYDFDVYNANKIEFTNAYSPNSNQLAIMQDRWRTIDPVNGETLQWLSNGKVYGLAPERLAAVNANAKIWQPLISTGAFTPSSWAIEDGSFLRINNVTLGYSFPIQRLASLRMSRLRFYVTANNLAVFTSYSGYDPEVSVRTDARTPNLDYSAYPKSRSFIVGVNASF